MPTSREPRVAIVGATGAVGNQLIELIGARGFPHSELKLFATESGASQTLDAAGEERLVEAFEGPESLAGFDLAFLAVPAPRAAEIIAADPGPVLIDLSAANSGPSDVPMVAPGLTTRAALEEYRGRKVFAVPHPAAHVLATCLNAMHVEQGFVAATAMLGASAGGRDMLATTVDQTTDLLSARLALEEDEVQRGFNIFVREHERSLATVISAQVVNLLQHSPVLSIQVVGVPILHGSGMTIEIPYSEDRGDVREILHGAPGLLIAEEGDSLSVIDAVGQEAIVVSIEARPGSVSLWCVFDNARLAALGALWIAETLVAVAPILA
jgi:aspartate-semialdehyde dehydrogenase